MAEKMSGAKLFAQMLKAYGVTHVFFMDAILRRVLAEMEDVGIKRILGHSEKAVAYMADGYARVTGRPGVCMAQSVGAANLAAGMQDPYLGHSPVIAFSGRHVAPNQYRNAYQEVPHEPLYAVGDQVAGPRRLCWSRFRTSCGRRSARRRPARRVPCTSTWRATPATPSPPTKACSTSSRTKRTRAFPRSARGRIPKRCRKPRPPSRPPPGR